MVKNWLAIVCGSFILISLIVHSFADDQSDRRQKTRIRGAKRFLQRRCDARYAGESWSSCMTKLQAYCLPRRSRSNRMCRMLRLIPKDQLGTSAKEDRQAAQAQPAPSTTRKPKRNRGGGGKGKQSTATRQERREMRRVRKANRKKIKGLNDRLNKRARRRAAQQSPRRLRRKWRRKNRRARRKASENDVNKNGDYFMGDLELSESQADQIEKELMAEESGNGRRKRKVGRTPLYKYWDMPINYMFDSSIPSATKSLIRESVKRWEANTCVRFQENGPKVNRIEFYDGGGCSSYVGMTGGVQQISIATPGCNHIGIIMHEIGHSLGFFHEQARPDQSKYVTVNYDNINSFRWNNFLPLKDKEVDTKQLPYDYGSVMHYDGYGFAVDLNKPTLEPNDEGYQSTIGQRNEPSFIDYAQINAAYCPSSCPSRRCANNGYAHPNDCSRCQCPTGFGGANCDTVQYSSCGGELKAYKNKGTIKSPNYPSKFRKGTDCYWLIKSTGGKINLKFTGRFDLECKTTCEESFVEVKGIGLFGSDFRSTGYRYCCDKPPTQVLRSDGDQLVVIFSGHGDTSAGFQAEFWADSGASGGGTTPTAKPQTAPPTTPTPRTTTHDSHGGHTDDPGGSGGVTDKPGCNCGAWTSWATQCSQDCGGCGSRVRRRDCGGNKNCYATEKRKCNFDLCGPDQRLLIKNGEIHVVWQGCCLGMFKDSHGHCGSIQHIFGELFNGFGSKLPNFRIGSGK